MSGSLSEMAIRLKAASYKYNITPNHMAMALFAMADVLDNTIIPNTEHLQGMAEDAGMNNISEMSNLYRSMAREIMR